MMQSNQVVTITELSKRLAISTTAVKKHIVKLKELGIVERRRYTAQRQLADTYQEEILITRKKT
jgi:predicted ArsR family transcriptional regulator